jgi:hypothetical protein
VLSCSCLPPSSPLRSLAPSGWGRGVATPAAGSPGLLLPGSLSQFHIAQLLIALLVKISQFFMQLIWSWQNFYGIWLFLEIEIWRRSRDVKWYGPDISINLMCFYCELVDMVYVLCGKNNFCWSILSFQPSSASAVPHNNLNNLRTKSIIYCSKCTCEWPVYNLLHGFKILKWLSQSLIVNRWFHSRGRKSNPSDRWMLYYITILFSFTWHSSVRV